MEIIILMRKMTWNCKSHTSNERGSEKVREKKNEMMWKIYDPHGLEKFEKE